MPAIGYVRKTENGDFVGELRTLTLTVGVRFVPNTMKSSPKQPDYLVQAENGYQVGGGWIKQGPKGEYLSLALAAPELGPTTFYANVSRNGEEASDRAIIWNPSFTRGRQRSQEDAAE